MSTLVKNVEGSSRFPKPKGYTSWLDYWEKMARREATKCAAIDCMCPEDLVGAHVQKVDDNDTDWYIVPLCQPCNKREDSFWVNEPLVPVPSNCR